MKYCNKNIRLDRPQTHNWEEYETQELRINKIKYLLTGGFGGDGGVRKENFKNKLQIKTN